MTRDEELILEKQKPYIRHANLDLFDGMPVPERKIKTSGCKKKKGDISATHPREINEELEELEELKEELTNQLQSILNDLKQATDNS